MSTDDYDSTTEVTEQSWLQRLGQAFTGIIIGILLVIVSVVLLVWNEGRAVTTARSLKEGAGLVQTVPADKVDAGNDGKLIHVIGLLTASGPAADSEFAMKSNGVRLIRKAQMYQWSEDKEEETTKNTGGSSTTKTTYKYKKEWNDQPLDSSKFHTRQGHENPQMTWRNRGFVAPNVKLGAFSMPDNLIDRLGSGEPVSAGDEQLQALQKRNNKPSQVVDGAIYVGTDPGQPAVGDYKISYTEVRRQAASVVARQAGSSFGPYQAKAGGAVELVQAGSVPAADMFKSAQDENRLITWAIRAGGAILMFIGFALIMRPLSVLADVLPILGDIVGAGAGLVALLMTTVLAPLTIAIAWFAYRPLVAVIVLVVGGALSYGALWLIRQRKAHKAAPAAA